MFNGNIPAAYDVKPFGGYLHMRAPLISMSKNTRDQMVRWIWANGETDMEIDSYRCRDNIGGWAQRIRRPFYLSQGWASPIVSARWPPVMERATSDFLDSFQGSFLGQICVFHDTMSNGMRQCHFIFQNNEDLLLFRLITNGARQLVAINPGWAKPYDPVWGQ